MKKLYSTIMLLAMMVAALSFTACGDDDEDEIEGGGSSSTIFSITIDGEKSEYDKHYLDNMNLTGRWEENEILIGTYKGDFRLLFPSEITFSSFTVGYDSFEDDAVKFNLGLRSCTYASGSATVIANDGKNMRIRFNNYKFTWNTSHEIIFDGTLNIVLIR